MMDMQQLGAQLRTVSHFHALSDANLSEIVNAGNVLKIQSGQMLFLQDEPCAGMYVLLQGRVNLCKLGPQGQQNILATILPVIMFNEVPVLDGGRNPVTALATQDSLLWRISCASFQKLLLSYPEIGSGLLHIMAARNRRLIEHYEDLSFRNVLARVAKTLLDLSDNGKKPISRREHSIEELAALTATVPQVISRTLKIFKIDGLINHTRQVIEVKKPENLAKIALLNINFLD